MTGSSCIEQLTVCIGDTEVDVDFRGFGRWYITKNGRRMKGLERWIMRSAKRHSEFNDILADAVRS